MERRHNALVKVDDDTYDFVNEISGWRESVAKRVFGKKWVINRQLHERLSEKDKDSLPEGMLVYPSVEHANEVTIYDILSRNAQRVCLKIMHSKLNEIETELRKEP